MKFVWIAMLPLICGCGQPTVTNTEKKTAESESQSTSAQVIDAATGQAAVKALRQAQRTVEKVNENQARTQNAVGE